MITRSVLNAAHQDHDLIIVGGGIYGACLAWNAVRRGLRPLLLEGDDFGHATSAHSLRILHGGFRYLQSGDLKRFRASVQERAWFASQFPELTTELKCILPLYELGMRRRATLRWALLANDALTRYWTAHLPNAPAVSGGRLLSEAEVNTHYPVLPQRFRGARRAGAAQWHDIMMTNAPRILVELLRWSCAYGATCLNYLRVQRLMSHQGRIVGVIAQDRVAGDEVEFRAPYVFDCRGPWQTSWSTTESRRSSEATSVGQPQFNPSMAFNVLFKRPALSSAALAVTPPTPGAATYFVVPRYGRLTIGTHHQTVASVGTRPEVTDATLATFLADINRIFTDLQLTPDDISQVQAGFLPAFPAGSARQAKRPIIRVHQKGSVTTGLVTVIGVKYTTARDVTAEAIRQIWPRRTLIAAENRPTTRHNFDTARWQEPTAATRSAWVRGLHELVSEESVICWDDLLSRRTDWIQQVDSPALLRQRIAEIAEQAGMPLQLRESPADFCDSPTMVVPS